MSINPHNQPIDAVEEMTQKQYQPPPVYYLQASQPIEDDEINLIDYWRILMRYKWLIILTTIISGGTAIAIAFQMTPIYRAEVILAPASEDKNAGLSAIAGQFGGLASLAGINVGAGGGKIEEAIATLKSRAFTEDFIRENNLMPILYSDIWDAEANKWRVDSEAHIPTPWKAYKLFDGIRFVKNDSKTGMYSIAFEWHDPVLAAQWANQIVEKINKHQKEAGIIEAKKSIEYLKNQLQETSVVEMRQAIYRLIEAQTKNIMLANVRDEFVFQVIDPAVVPEEKIKPKKKLMAILGVIVGFMLGVFLAFILAFIKKQKEQLTNENNQPTGQAS